MSAGDEVLWADAEVRQGGPDGPLLRVKRVAVPAVPAERRRRPGDPVRLGDIVGHPMEPWERWARVVALRKGAGPGEHRMLLRLYASDTERWPSGEYRTAWWVVAWEPDGRGVA